MPRNEGKDDAYVLDVHMCLRPYTQTLPWNYLDLSFLTFVHCFNEPFEDQM